MRFGIAALVLCIVQAAAAQSTDTFLARAMALHRAVPMIDTHNDLPEMLREQSFNDLEQMDPDRPLPKIDTAGPMFASDSKPSTNSDMMRKMRQESDAPGVSSPMTGWFVRDI